MKHPYVEITDSLIRPQWFMHVYCHDKPVPPRGGFLAGTIQRTKSGWMFCISPTCDTMLDAEDRANLYIVVDEHITVLNITNRLLK